MTRKKGRGQGRRRGPAVPGTIRVHEAAERLGVHENTVYAWIETGRIPYVRLGRMVRLRPSVVDALIEEIPAAPARGVAVDVPARKADA